MSLKKIEQELHDLRKQNEDLQNELKKQKEICNQRTIELLEARKSLQRLDRIERELHSLPPVQVGADPAELESLRTMNLKQKAEIADLKEQLTISQSNRRIEAELMQSLKELEQSFKQKLKEQSEKLNLLELNNEKISRNNQILKQELQELEQTNKTLKANNQALIENCEELQRANEVLTENTETLKANTAELMQTIEDLKENNNALLDNNEELANELESLQTD